MVHSVLSGGATLIAGVLCFVAASQTESLTQLPSWQKLMEMAAAEMDAGSELSSIYRIPVLIAVGRSYEAIASLSGKEHEVLRQLNSEVACGLLEKDDSEFADRAKYCSNLAAILFYCRKQERADEYIRLATGFIDRSFEELRKEIDSGSASPVKLSLTATSLLETTGRVAALLANSGRLEEARKLIESTKTKVQTVTPDKEMNDDWAIVRMLIDTGAIELADEFVSAARSPFWRCHFQIKLCEELAQRKRREDAIARLQKVIPQFSLEADPVNRFGLQSDTIQLLKALNEEQIRSKLVQEVIEECLGHGDPKDWQSVFLLLVDIRDHEKAWSLLQERELAGSNAMNLALLGFLLHDLEITTSGKK